MVCGCAFATAASAEPFTEDAVTTATPEDLDAEGAAQANAIEEESVEDAPPEGGEAFLPEAEAAE